MRIHIGAISGAKIKQKCIYVPESFRHINVTALEDNIEMFAGVRVKQLQSSLVDGYGAPYRRQNAGNYSTQCRLEETAPALVIIRMHETLIDL